jgi:sec-independent protein translocase protein TatB
MFSVPHIVILFVVVLVLFGPHKLPELARGLGKLMAEFRKASTDFKMAFEEEMRNVERQARELEWKKSQEAATAAAAAIASEPQSATTSTTAESETPRILPESVEPIEPIVSPVSESVSRESHPESEVSAPVSNESVAATEESSSPEIGKPPAHDQQQPA